MIQHKHITLLLIFALSAFYGLSQSNCFPKPVNFKFVYDEANIISDQNEQALNNKLRAFTQNTSNVLVVVTKTDLCGYDKAKYTYTCLEEMGVGRADLDNGLVLMVKPKEIDGQGETFIATGKGLQGAITDLGTGRIVRNEMIPQFKRENYYQGIDNASNILISLASGEISEENYLEKTEGKGWLILVFFAIFIILFIIAQKNGGGKGDDWETFDGNGKRTGRRRSSGSWIWLGGAGFGGGSSSGGGFGSSGGFGGFGGGGSFGGGAGGSW